VDIIVDLDGTLADCDWRLHHIKEKPKNWKAFFDGIILDKPIEPIVELVYHATQCGRMRPIYCTGRPENYRGHSYGWLVRHVEPSPEPIYMRPTGDHRPDYEVKKDLLYKMRADGFNPILAIDDKPEVCEMFQKEGLIVLQVRKPQ
jgi:hypothetical protein